MVFAEPIFVLSGQATAQSVEGYRPGARHQLLILMRAPDLDKAAARATGMTLQHGFHYLTIEQGSQMDMKAEDAEHEYLRNAILKVEETGQAIIVYDDELPSDD